jgi:hypothetical protein
MQRISFQRWRSRLGSSLESWLGSHRHQRWWCRSGVVTISPCRRDRICCRIYKIWLHHTTWSNIKLHLMEEVLLNKWKKWPLRHHRGAINHLATSPAPPPSNPVWAAFEPNQAFIWFRRRQMNPSQEPAIRYPRPCVSRLLSSRRRLWRRTPCSMRTLCTCYSSRRL